MALYGALAKGSNLSDLSDAAAATANLRIIQNFTGNHKYVDSGHASATDDAAHGARTAPFATLDFAIENMTASNGDVIWVLAGHNEDIIAADGLNFDVIGLTVVFLGEGAARASITFKTAVGADMEIDAEGTTLVNFRGIAGIDALTGPIDVNAANFTMINALWEDAAGLATTDCLVADANATDMLIDGWEYRVSTTGTQKQSNIQIAGATRPVLKNIRITGDFGTGPIENGTAWIDATLDRVFVDNAAAGPVVGILLQSGSSGQMRDVNIRVASGTTYLTADNNMQFFNCFGVGVDADGAEQIGAIMSTSVEGKLDTLTGSTLRTITKTDGAVLNGDDALFTITGGSIYVVSIVGTVTTIFGGTVTCHLNCAVTTPSADVSMSTAVAVNSAPEGSVWTFVGPSGILTPTDPGLTIIDQGSTTLTETHWIVPIGGIELSSSAAQTGVISFTMTYWANSEATVTVAA